MVRLAGLALLLAVSACTTTDVFTCQTDDQCLDGQQAGLCRPQGYCSFPDGACDGGHRFSEHAGPLAGECVTEAGDTEVGSSTTTTEPGSGATSTPGTTDATTAPADSTSEDGGEIGDGPPDVPDPSSGYEPCDDDCATCFIPSSSQQYGACTQPCRNSQRCLPYSDASGVRYDLECATVDNSDALCLLLCDEQSPCPEGTTCKGLDDPTLGACVWPL